MLTKLIFLLYQPFLALRDLLASEQASTPSTGKFVKGINLGGGAVTIEGNRWESYSEALKTGLSTPAAQVAKTYVVPHPYANRDVRTLLNTVVFKAHTLNITQALPSGEYAIYLWMMENYQTNWHALEVKIDGQTVAKNVGQMQRGHWLKYGPYAVTVTNGVLNLALSTNNPDIDAHLMGISIHQSLPA